MSEKNIVILGSSFGGLGTAHYLLKHVVPKLQTVAKDTKYVIHLVSPTTHFWWNIAAPREIISVDLLKHDQCFVPIMDGFKQYPEGSVVFHHGSATALDTEARTVTVTPAVGDDNADAAAAATDPTSLTYDTLVIATGARTPTPLTTLHGDYTVTQRALEELNAKLPNAGDIVISGGGPVGVEVAGEIGARLRGKAKITLVTGAEQLLPVFKFSRAAKAAKQLQKVGVRVIYKTKVTDTSTTDAGKTTLTLSDGQTLTADVYIPAHGVTPNTQFLPAALKQSNGYVATNGKTLRVDAAGPRVYAAGDVAGVDRGGVLNMFNTIPILGNNIAHDLLGAAVSGSGGSSGTVEVPPTKTYVFKPAETQLVPVGPSQGVGAFNGWGLPGFMVKMVKGKDYMVGNIPQWTQGTAFAKA